MVLLPQSIVMTYLWVLFSWPLFSRERGNEAISCLWWGWNFPYSLLRINQVCHWFLLGTINQVLIDHRILVVFKGTIWGFFRCIHIGEAVGTVWSYRNHQVLFLISMNNAQQGRIQTECWNVVKLWLILFGDYVYSILCWTKLTFKNKP